MLTRSLKIMSNIRETKLPHKLREKIIELIEVSVSCEMHLYKDTYCVCVCVWGGGGGDKLKFFGGLCSEQLV